MPNGTSSTGPPPTTDKPIEYIWRPQPGPQKALIDCPLPEILYGGARGGGKTDGVLGKYALKAGRYGRHFNAVFFRRELPMLDDAIERSAEIYERLGARWNDQKKTWRFRAGGRLRFRPLERVRDADKYQGQNITDACVEEAGNYPDPAPIDRINGVLRSAHGVPTQLILTGNPGGPGQLWIKLRYIDPAPSGMKILTRNLPNGKEHRYVFIPSRLQHNRMLTYNDPDYVNRLYLVGSEELVRAWLDGDWSVIAGAFFPEFSIEKHVIKPFTVPAHWARIRACDWGSARPFAVGWFAVSDGELEHIPRGALVMYREWYGIRYNRLGQFEPNVGLKMTAEEVGSGIAEREAKGEHIERAVIDPSAHKEDGGPSIAERMALAGASFAKADNKRVPKAGAMGGWDQVRARLKGEDGRPMIYFFDTCIHTIRTFPAMQHDDLNAEDMDTEGEDHAVDMVRYGCMARPYVRDLPLTPSKGVTPFAGDSWLNAGVKRKKGPRFN
jgi:hypothetical protein